MDRFKALVDGNKNEESLIAQKVLICQALIKCADISNPVRFYLFIFNKKNTMDSSLLRCRVDRIGCRSIGLER
jgi:hypothetical protein